MSQLDVKGAMSAYADGQNVMDYLRHKHGIDHNNSEIIELSYDLQAGSYAKSTELHIQERMDYAKLMSEYIRPHLNGATSLLDVGTGELSTISLLANHLDENTSVFAFDISWSRLFKGQKFWNKWNKNKTLELNLFVADMKEIPLLDNSVDVVTSNHAIEPNGECLKQILSEIFRVCSQVCVLFEPSFELNSAEGKARMAKHGYIRNLQRESEALGGTVLSIELFPLTHSKLNPTACYVIAPPKHSKMSINSRNHFSAPGTNLPLTPIDNFLYSEDMAVAFPILKNIPLLRSEKAILATALLADRDPEGVSE